MMHKRKKIILITIIVITCFLLTSLLLTYFSGSKDPVSRFFKKIYPAVIVDADQISIFDFEVYHEVAMKLDKASANKDIASGKIIKNFKAKILASKLKVEPSREELNKEFEFLTNNKDEYSQVVKDYFFMDPNLYQRFVVEPNAIEGKIRIKYNSDLKFNRAAYDEASDVHGRIKAGEKFEDMAQTESDDKLSGQFGGDLGFFQRNQILPELADAITAGRAGQLVDWVVVSREGFHIVLPLEGAQKNGNQLLRAKHILIQTQGFENWQDAQFAKTKVLRLK